ncbi:PaaI family thioesterase [Mailhella sp.]|uniref:PaaI family thioesterase n=1 Tax=Mailhella sp. TaxID=1981029 RepID=UPI003AB31AB5
MFELITEGTLAGLLGVTVDHFDEEGRGAVSMPMDSRHLNVLGNAHGGAIFTLADMAFAAGCRGAGLLCVSAQCSISYLLPGTCGPLRAEATPVKLGRTLAVFDIMVYDGEGRNIAKAVMTGYVLRRLTDGEKHD